MMRSPLRRALEVGKMMSAIGIKELAPDKVSSRVEQAKILVQSLGSLKGAAMKAGQILSLDLGDYFPPEAQQILRQLQNNPQKHVPIDVEKTLREELDKDIFHRIVHIEKEPFAAASIGQAYRATVIHNDRERDVVFKIQYPFVADTIDSDLKIIENLAKTLCFLSGREMNLEPLFQEIKVTLKNETDYKIEKEFHLKFQNLVSSKKWQSFQIQTPEIIEDFCTDKVLCSSFVQGVSLSEWIASNPSTEQRLEMARTVLDLYISELFEWGLVQTDPNPSNFLVHNNQLNILDFGAAKKYSDEFRHQYLELSKRIYEGRDSEIIKAAMKFNLIDKRESADAQAIFLDLLKLGISPLHHKTFNFSDDHYSKENSKISKKLISTLKYSPPPYQLIFLHRKLGGVYSILRKLSVELEMTPWWQKIESIKFPGHE